jgi:diguanylate cyclase (GGDEF)-like protein
VPGGSERPRLPARLRYALIGVALGVGAPAGALVIRLSGAVNPALELRDHGFFYLYMLVGTCLVFGYMGFHAGRRADRLRESRDRFHNLSEKDDVTDLPNIRAFEEHLRRAAEHAEQFREPLSLLIVDLDSHKAINDRWGHAVGSASLRHVAAILSESKRHGDFAARWGGDEFTILMPGADREAAGRLAQTIVERLRASPVVWKGESYPVTVTVGSSTLRGGGAGSDLFIRADRALYEGKLRGRNQYRAAPEEPVESARKT